MINEDEVRAAMLAQDREDLKRLRSECEAAALKLFTVTTEDRLRGAIRAAMSELQENRPVLAWTTLNAALKL